jgi:predicted molibdopterin-dependent oxidoreductase YjgC
MEARMTVATTPATLGRSATTVCPFCGTGCGVLLAGTAAYPRTHHPVSQGALCLRGWSAGELTSSPLRVLNAYARRRGDPLQPAAVDATLTAVAERLAGIRDRHGAASIGILGSARITVEETLLLRRLAAAIGTPHLDSFQRSGYLSLPALDLDALEKAPRVTVLGANLAMRQPQVGRRLLRAFDRGARVRFVHSRRAQLTSLAAEHVVALPGHELESLGEIADDEVVLVSSEIVLSGQGVEAERRLAGRRAMFLTDYANQRGAVEAGLRPRPDGWSAWEMLEAAARGELKALLVFADDPREFFPALGARAFAGTELTVVVDAVKTPTGGCADVVLPGALLSEKNGTVVNTEGRVQEIGAVSAPAGGWTEGAVAARLIERLGADAPLPALPAAGHRGRAVEAERPGGDRPFLAALDTTLFWNSHALVSSTITVWREMRNLFADFPPGCVTMNPEDAREAGVQYASAVKLSGPDGSITLPARLHPRMLRGTVWIAMPCWEGCGTRLGALDYDRSLRMPLFRPRAVRISKPGAGGAR